MKLLRYVKRTAIPVPAEELAQWHFRPGAFERIMPPFEAAEVVANPGMLADGLEIKLRVQLGGPMAATWLARLHDCRPGEQFADLQVIGPFAHWDHTHRFLPDGPEACVLEDDIAYAPPLGALGTRLAGGFLRRKLDRMFTYRHAVTRDDLIRHHAYRDRPRLRILVTGSHGSVGAQLVPFLTTGGHTVVRLARGKAQPTQGAVVDGTETRLWQPEERRLDPGVFEGIDAVIHLAGENIASGRWNAQRKERLRSSRVESTRLLTETLRGLAKPPRVFLSASATGYYGDRGEAKMNERDPAGSGFLPELCAAWEAPVAELASAGVREARLRIGVVLTPKAGALAKQLLPFQLGLGATLGSGKQYLSWISMDDVVAAIHHVLMTDTLRGPVNLVSPHAVTNREFTRTLARVLNRPAILNVPGFAARTLFGELADALLLASTRVVPTQLLTSGFRFSHPGLPSALRHVLGR